MCKCLKISRQTYYTYLKNKNRNKIDIELEEEVIRIFNDNRKAYGSRRIKQVLARKNKQVSRRLIRRIMRKHNLVSCYQVKKYRTISAGVNEKYNENLVKQSFNNHEKNHTLVSDLTYVKVNNKWHYICIICDLYNREIVGYGCHATKSAVLVKETLLSMKVDFKRIKVFHTDRGKEFDNQLIESVLDNNNIKHSLSKKGCPYDNAVAESTFKTIKKEFIYGKSFETIAHLKRELSAFVYWYNNIRIHSTLDYVSPVQYKQVQKQNTTP